MVALSRRKSRFQWSVCRPSFQARTSDVARACIRLSLSFILILTYLPTTFTYHRRRMAGGPFPERMNAHKNKFVEEWNGRREITELKFKVTPQNAPIVFISCVAIPFFFYAQSKAEFQSRGDRRYKELC